MATITICVCVYNEEIHIVQTLKSLLAQTYTDFHLIIADNASTDKTGLIAKKFAHKDSRITYLRREVNVGSLENFRSLVPGISTPYITFAAGHDLYAPTFLEACLSLFTNNPHLSLAHTRSAWLIDNVPVGVIPGCLDTQSLSQVMGMLTTLNAVSYGYAFYGVIRTEILKQCKIYNVLAPDIVLLLELAGRGPIAMHTEPLLFMRRNKDYGDIDSFISKIGLNRNNPGDITPFQEIVSAYIDVIERTILDPLHRNLLANVILCQNLMVYTYALTWNGANLMDLTKNGQFSEILDSYNLNAQTLRGSLLPPAPGRSFNI